MQTDKPHLKYYTSDGKYFIFHSVTKEHKEIKEYEYNSYIELNQRVFNNLLIQTK